MFTITNVSIMATPENQKEDIDWYDFSGLSAISQCNRKGLLTAHHKLKIKPLMDMPENQNTSAGTLFHGFASCYNMAKDLWSSLSAREIARIYRLEEFSLHDYTLCHAAAAEISSSHERALVFTNEIFQCIPFADPVVQSARAKTKDAVYKAGQLWAATQKNRSSKCIAVEQSFDMILSITYDSVIDATTRTTIRNQNKIIRLVGLIDAVFEDEHGNVFPLDYKSTGMYLNNTYLEGFRLSPQLVIYSWALKVLSSGLAKDLSKQQQSWIAFEHVVIPPVSGKATTPNQYRNLFQVTPDSTMSVLEWILTQMCVIDNYGETPEYAIPSAPHSCTAYNQLCPFINYCSLPTAQRREFIINDMVESDWDPTK